MPPPDIFVFIAGFLAGCAVCITRLRPEELSESEMFEWLLNAKLKRKLEAELRAQLNKELGTEEHPI